FIGFIPFGRGPASGLSDPSALDVEPPPSCHLLTSSKLTVAKPPNMTSSSRMPRTSWTTQQIAWNHDGDEGHPPSITVLLNWLERDNNYKRWRQDTTKVVIRWEVVAELKAHGIAHRNGAVCCLLFQSIDSFAFPAHMRMICKHWTGLDPLMGPLMTHADELLSGSSAAFEPIPAAGDWPETLINPLNCSVSGNAHETYLHAHSPCVHISLIAMTTRRAPRLGVSWDTDATDSHPSSIITLIDWLGANNNYSRYRGAHCKRMVLLEIERHLLMQGIKNCSVRGKIFIHHIASWYIRSSNHHLHRLSMRVEIRMQIDRLRNLYKNTYAWCYHMIQERETGRFASIDVIDFE
ncbi:hypothetical protein MJO29_006792, partial [Puccinia striiformis f. sp. tritici]